MVVNRCCPSTSVYRAMFRSWITTSAPRLSSPSSRTSITLECLPVRLFPSVLTLEVRQDILYIPATLK